MRNYFEDRLRSWQVNIDIQPVFNEYNTTVYMWSCSSKSEDQCSVAMMQAGEESFANNCDYFETTKRSIQFSNQSYPI